MHLTTLSIVPIFVAAPDTGFKVASLYLDMPKGVSRWAAHHRNVAEAGELDDELAERARRHRSPRSLPPPAVAESGSAPADATHSSESHRPA